MKKILVVISCCSFILLTSFVNVTAPVTLPATVTRTTTFVNDNEVERTIVSFNKHTSREAVIETCRFLAGENVQLTFDKLTIGRRGMQVFSRKNHIVFAEGNIALSNGRSEHFKAGGITGIKLFRIQYTNNATDKKSQIEMIEIID